ncbi:MAG: DUF429 domain-containing protein [Alphaproteobacteria bacterium]
MQATITTTVLGVDFTSAPRTRKPIVVASGTLRGRTLRLTGTETFADWPGFESLLARPGPWIGGFDFPFGLPRETVATLGWPRRWDRLVARCAGFDRRSFREVLDASRAGRAVGDRFPHRATDRPARSHSPLKFVNPPVGWMFLEGAPRLLRAGVTVPGLHAGDPARIAVEAYPGFAARRITRASYKSDDPRRDDASRRRVRREIADALAQGAGADGLRLAASPSRLRELVGDPSGDRLDAAIAALQAAWCLARREDGFGLPRDVDPSEGWIACVPPPGPDAEATPSAGP